ncbi:MAG: SDR family oxidoreductase [Chloroflexi bacterium]|nr:SDR family oxidoreductase [Chloroflexota bacterium]
MMALDGTVALVTGASKGIGQTIAIALATAGADVGVNYHTDRAGADATCANIAAAGHRALPLHADVSDRTAVERMFRKLQAQFGTLDILVNNAAIGIGHQGTFADYPLDAWQRVFAVNLEGVVHCTQAALKIMLARQSEGRQQQSEGRTQETGGRIINISSSHSLVFQRRTSAYTVAKGALNTLTQALAVEFGPQGITVNCIAAGAVSTPGWPASPQGQAAWIRRAPRARMGKAEDIANAVVYLASPQADYITGQILCVDGGYVHSVTPMP